MARIEDAIARLRALVAQPNPAMRCTGRDDEERVFACAHEVGAPAGRVELDAIRKAVGPEAAADFAKFYAAFGELVLYRNAERAGADDETALIHIVPVAGWDELREGLETWLEGLEEEDWEEEADPGYPDHPDGYPRSIFRDAVPFAQVPHSADVIFVAGDGEFAGRVFQMDHETLAPMHRADSFAEFVEVLASDTDRAVEWFNSGIRYCDDKRRREQWFPVGVATSGKAA